MNGLLQGYFFPYAKREDTNFDAQLLPILKTGVAVFIESHTDMRGTKKENQDLSDRRAKATVQYIISKGIAKERISGQGFGESEPKVNCTKCTEAEHAQNRRSEFLIVKK
jgi:outer membrane protein OmpA-like peptidoglycan-associated protein